MSTLLRLTSLCLVAALAHAQSSPCYRTPAELAEGVQAAGYQRLNRPAIAAAGSNDAPAENVSLFFDMKYLLAVEQRVQRLDFQGQFDVVWRDERLAFDATCAGAESMNFHQDTAAQWWLPRPRIANEISTNVEGNKDVSVSVAADGTVAYSTRRRVLTKCAMEFKNMPYDKQKCPVVFRVLDGSGVALQAAQRPESKPRGNPEWNLKTIDRYQGDQTITLSVKLARRSEYWRKYVIIPTILFVLISYSSFYVARTAAPARVGATVVCFLVIMNFITHVLASLPKVDYDVRLLTFLYLSMWFCGFACFEYALVNMLLRVEQRVEKARAAAEAEHGIKSIDEKRASRGRIKAKTAAAAKFARSLRGRKSPVTSRKEPPPPPERSAVDLEAEVAKDAVEAKIEAEVREAAGRFGRLTLVGADMWIKDQHLDIACRWLFLPLYVFLSSLSLNFRSA